MKRLLPPPTRTSPSITNNNNNNNNNSSGTKLSGRPDRHTIRKLRSKRKPDAVAAQRISALTDAAQACPEPTMALSVDNPLGITYSPPSPPPPALPANPFEQVEDSTASPTDPLQAMTGATVLATPGGPISPPLPPPSSLLRRSDTAGFTTIALYDPTVVSPTTAKLKVAAGWPQNTPPERDQLATGAASSAKSTHQIRRWLSFIGPGFLVAVGYMDPGNWATDLAAGSRFGYSLLSILLVANLATCLFQAMAARLGLVTGRDLAEQCRRELPAWLRWPLYAICEAGVIAVDLAEVIGSAVALELLVGVPLPVGICITALDILVLLCLYRPERFAWSTRVFELAMVLLVAAVGVCALLLALQARPAMGEVLLGLLPDRSLLQMDHGRLLVAMALIGATVMPHNLFLHSHAVKSRVYESTDPDLRTERSTAEPGWRRPTRGPRRKPAFSSAAQLRQALTMTVADSALALTIAALVNMTILVMAATALRYTMPGGGERAAHGIAASDLYDVHRLLRDRFGAGVAVLYATALLVAGQCGALTCTLSGQVVMEGFLGLRMRPWLRRLVTRACALVPAMVIACTVGREGVMRLLLATQIGLGIQLPFAVVPLIWLVSKRRVMQPPKASAADVRASTASSLASACSSRTSNPRASALAQTHTAPTSLPIIDVTPVDPVQDAPPPGDISENAIVSAQPPRLPPLRKSIVHGHSLFGDSRSHRVSQPVTLGVLFDADHYLQSGDTPALSQQQRATLFTSVYGDGPAPLGAPSDSKVDDDALLVEPIQQRDNIRTGCGDGQPYRYRSSQYTCPVWQQILGWILTLCLTIVAIAVVAVAVLDA